MSRGFKVFLGVLTAVVLLAIPGFGPAGEAIAALLFGWIRFVKNVAPRISLNPSAVGMFVLCLAAAAVVGHRFCRWLRQGEPWRWRWTVAGLSTVVVLFASGMAFTGVAHQVGWLLRSPAPLTHGGGSNERNSASSLKTIASAQADFRGNDRDGNRIADYWRGDIAGLYALKPDGSPDMIKLIDLSVAAADAAPTTPVETVAVRSPKAGYWYRALRFKGETTPDPDRFAAIGYPDSLSAGRWMYLISHENTLYKKEFVPGALPEACPDDPLKEGWVRLD